MDKKSRSDDSILLHVASNESDHEYTEAEEIENKPPIGAKIQLTNVINWIYTNATFSTNQMLCMMVAYLGVTFLIATLQTSISSCAVNNKLKRAVVHRSQQSFFANDSHIIDFQDGNNAHPDILLQKSEILLLYIYAPWSLLSKKYALELDRFSKNIDNQQISIAAVNCWAPSSQCHQSFHLFTYPVLIAYIRHSAFSIPYRGPLQAGDIWRFTHRLLAPFVHITSEVELAAFHRSGDTTILTFIDFTTDNAQTLYTHLYESALLTLVYDSTGASYQIGLITNESLGRVVNVHHGWMVKRILNNDQTIYKLLTPSTNTSMDAANKLAKWIMSREHVKSNALNIKFIPINAVPFEKTETLHRLLNSDTPNITTLLLFTKRPLASPNDQISEAVSIVRQLAFEMSTPCSQRTKIFDNAEKAHLAYIHEIEQHAKLVQYCDERKHHYTKLRACCQKLLPLHGKSIWPMAQSLINMTSHQSFTYRDQCSPNDVKADLSNLWHSLCVEGRRRAMLKLPDQCETVADNLSMLIKYCCGHMKAPEKLKHSASHMYQARIDSPLACNNQLFEQEIHRVLMNEKQEQKRVVSAIDLHAKLCATNRTVNVAMIDIDQYGVMLKDLGVLRPFESSHALLVDSYYEQTHHTDDLSINSLRRLVYDHATFSNEILRRDVDTTIANDETDQNDQILLQVATSSTYKSLVYDRPSVNTLVLHTGGRWCAACYTVTHVIHTLATFFDKLYVAKHRDRQWKDLEFVIIDASVNDLPWEDTVVDYPTVMFYPAYRKRQAPAVFPPTLQLTVPNLLAFTLAHSGARFRWHLAFSLCNHQCLERNFMQAKMEYARTRAILRQVNAHIRAYSAHDDDLTLRYHYVHKAKLSQSLIVIAQFLDIMNILKSDSRFIEDSADRSVFLDYIINSDIFNR